jgi:hypothetical protein
MRKKIPRILSVSCACDEERVVKNARSENEETGLNSPSSVGLRLSM